MSDILSPQIFLEKVKHFPFVDVRTPSEFEKGHIPGAINIPLFSDEERAKVGTIYKQQGKRQAIFAGLDLVGPRMKQLAKHIEHYAQEKGEIGFYCWRGGMRSESIAWLAELLGFKTFRLDGGYKGFRRYLLEQFEEKQNIIILSGMTGSGKTAILHVLAKLGEQVIDLEGLAHHKGSAFGAIGEIPQPSQQNFENHLALEWLQLNRQRVLWLENESLRIGKNVIPKPLWEQMRKAHVISLDVPRELRVQHLLDVYGSFGDDPLEHSILSISKRLGPQQTKAALDALQNGRRMECADILLEHYYDKTYLYSLKKRPPEKIHHLSTDTRDPTMNARKLLEYYNSLQSGTSSF